MRTTDLLAPTLCGLLLASLACTEPPQREASDPNYEAALALLDEVRDETMDLNYEDKQYAPVLAAFKEVNSDSPDRELADYWVQKLQAGQDKVKERRADIQKELNRTPEEYRDYLNLLREEMDERRAGGTPDKGKKNAPARDAVVPTPEETEEEAAAPSVGDVDNSGRGRDHWQGRRRALNDSVSEYEIAVAAAERRVRYACGDAMTHRTSERRTVEAGELQDLTHAPKEIRHEDPKRLRCAAERETLDAAIASLEAARAKLAGLKDEARRAGAQPGWIR